MEVVLTLTPIPNHSEFGFSGSFGARRAGFKRRTPGKLVWRRLN